MLRRRAGPPKIVVLNNALVFCSQERADDSIPGVRLMYWGDYDNSASDLRYGRREGKGIGVVYAEQIEPVDNSKYIGILS